MFARGERVSKVEGVVAAGNAHLANLIEFDGDAPGAAPGQGSKPNVAGFFVGEITARNGEPGIVLLAGGAAAALEESFAGLNALLVKKKFAAPAPGQIAQAVSLPWGSLQVPAEALLTTMRTVPRFSMRA